ncbi:PrsW family intramembrane metalloprotease [Natrarchaeobaculum aegyptiacum]|uniref:Protease PrsW n=1 Tax=Natrarchaeobaculum aegyptiacum TaxID=745377 RepID=A0A2Z2HRU2_9EURY|nr:PrsW family intramembrane metalloprotease [Natrarchaeobaculum aegyptiacum]ARS88805.1 protease PrsW [Natrarchaeobaculum aegyptiacum]
MTEGDQPRPDGARGAPDDAADGLSERLGRTVRIARWELSRSTGTVDRETVLVVLAVLAVVGVVGLSTAEDGLGLDDEIYVVGVDSDDPYHDVALESNQFRSIPLEEVHVEDGDGNVDLVILPGGQIETVGDHGGAAYDAFRDAVAAYTERQMAAEPDEGAAFPVLVTLDYEDRSFGGVTGQEVDGTADVADDDLTADETVRDDGADAGAENDTGEDDLAAGDLEPSLEADDGRLAVPDVGSAGEAQTAPGTPGSLAPPFPFQSLVLAFLLIVPMNLVIQAYGSTIMDERIGRRGELLLVSPASPLEIVAGKTLPYLLGLLAIVVGIVYAIGGGILAVAGALPIGLAFLAATFTGAMFARSFKELTFVTVTISVVLTTYVFVPAIFSDVTPIALISPLTLVVLDLQGESVALAEYLFSTGPFYLGSLVCALLGLGIYREEDMFDQKPVPGKALDAIVSQIDAISSRSHPYATPAVLSALFVPFVFGAQLLVVALLFAVPASIAVPITFLLAAAVEEVAKSVHIYAGYARSRFEATIGTGIVLGVVSGIGFFVAEKVTHAVQLVGLPDLSVGVAAFGPALSSDPLVLVAILLAPLVLHVVTAAIAAVGATRGRSTYVAAVGLATLVHAGYNVGVIGLVA